MKVRFRIFQLILVNLFTLSLIAQNNSPENRIIVLGEAKIEVPADQILFTISLQATHPSDVNAVYEQHQAQEKKLVALLKNLKIPDRNIEYSLMSVNKEFDYETKEPSISSSQQITFHIDSIQLYTQVQTRLIKEGFTEIDSDFTSSQIHKVEKDILEQAITNAREKATILANASGRKLHKVVKIADIDENDPAYNYSTAPPKVATLRFAGISTDDSTLLNVVQFIQLATRVKVVFSLK
ncbi:SIMPL domain-containing protein [Cytophagaceae bacterium DM2B3-1]|uniref:SIMPL domain-containing protein n=1 Tax=Xanthocytophaga flava TaxID=3048013 RepID=A0ABT7CX33_9BACT|nr:SIMPL domain-containing protein [Xanthocytophaga flavus]MDJ1471809.1 SIMPL domain-containing protein [Xanthocytophaga flavus]MDJ1497169.1 SIMPL domain-containing protein [Xanthocytophaga flavus]